MAKTGNLEEEFAMNPPEPAAEGNLKENEAKKEDASEEMETIVIPMTDEDKDDKFLCINGRGIYVKRGEAQKVPKPYAELWKNSQMQASRAMRYQMENENKQLTD